MEYINARNGLNNPEKSVSFQSGEETYFVASMINLVKDAIVSVDLNGIITCWNRAASILYDYPAEKAIGSSITEVNFPPAIAALLKSADRNSSGLQDKYEVVILNQYGHETTAELQLIPIKGDDEQLLGFSTIARDIVPKQMSSALESTEHRLRLISDIIPQIIWENDLNGKAIYFNKRWFEYSGKSQEESEGPGWPVISHVEDYQSISDWKEALSSGKIFESKARLKRKDGLYLWHLLRNVPLKDSDGRVLGWYGSATDIDELRSVELSLTRTKETLRSILEAVVDFAIIMLDEQGYITEWNHGAELTFGYTREEALGAYTGIIFTSEDKHGNIPAVEIERASRTGRSLDERWHLRKNGSRFFMSGVLTPIYHESIKGYVKVARNITERKLMEEALFLSEQRNTIMLQSSEMGEWKWDIQPDVFQGNNNVCTLTGLEAGHQTPLDNFLDLIMGEDIMMVRERLHTALDGLNVFEAEFRILQAGTNLTRWVRIYGRVIAHNGSIPVKMIGVMYDITERKTQEKQKDDFISIASHELKTPVTSIQAYSNILQEVMLEANDQYNVEIIQKLNWQVERLVRLIYNLLDITNIAEGRIKIFPVEFNLNALLEEQLKELQVVAGTRRLIWKPSNVSHVHADPERIRQVVVNFVSNAIRYSPEQSDIIISTEDDQDGVFVRVKDFGIGISPEDQAHIFRRYYRVQGKEIENNPGFGLGLYISAEIIREHYGFIGVDSSKGAGSTFYFKLLYS